MAKFPFNDLQSFKDYVGFVKLCAPDMFPSREGVARESQWTLDLAFEGLYDGVKLAISEKGNRPEFHECITLITDAKTAYLKNNFKEGYLKLDSMATLLRGVPTWELR